LDGDTLFRRDTARRLVEPFVDPRVAAVAGTAEVGNPHNALTRMQALEYLVQQEVERRAWDTLAAVPVVPGAVGAWRRNAVAAVGRGAGAGWARGALVAVEAAQARLACALGRRGYRLLPWLLAARLFYRPILFGIVLRSLARSLDGIPLGWNKLARRGTARLL